MAILVTGGAGYIGSHVVAELLDDGEQVIVLDNLSTGFRSAVPDGASLVVGESGDCALLASLMAKGEIDAIMHFAAKLVVPESVVDPLAYYENNTSNARTLLQQAVEHRIQQFIFSSTAAVYGEPASVPVAETSPLNPINPYGRSKLMVEWMLEDVSKAHDFNYAALRYFNVAGADPAGRLGQSTTHATHLIKVAVQAALGTRNGMDLYGLDYATPDGSCIRDYVQVTDLARAHTAALRFLRDGKANIVCNVGYSHGFSVLEVIEAVKKVSGVDFEVRTAPRRAGDPAQLISANHRIREIGWRPAYDDLDTIVRQALAWESKLARRPTVAV